jgi:hypothetical protein
MLRTLRQDSRRAECQLLEPQTQRLDAAGRIDRACRTAVDMYTNLEKPCSRIYRACRTAVDMYTNLEKLAALRYCYDLGGCVTVKIASIQGSKRSTFCSATPDAIYSQDEEKERKVGRYLMFVFAHSLRAAEAR